MKTAQTYVSSALALAMVLITAVTALFSFTGNAYAEDTMSTMSTKAEKDLQKIYYHLKTRGWTDEMAAGAIGNINVESEGDPTVAERGKAPTGWGRNADPNDLDGWGIVQWTGPRHKDIREYVDKTIGKHYYASQLSTPKASDWMTEEDRDLLLYTQVDYMDYEMRTNAKDDPAGYYTRTLWKPFIAAKTPEEATTVFVKKYEKPLMSTARIELRQKTAREAYDKWSKTSPPRAEISLTESPAKVEFVTNEPPIIAPKAPHVEAPQVVSPSIPVSETKKNSPLKFSKPFNSSARMTAGYPTYPKGGYHTGVDYVPNGSDPSVLSVTNGTIVHAGYVTDTGYGNLVVVRYGATNVMYAHLDSLNVTVGQEVSAGDILGTMGATSAKYTMDKHLHFEVREGASGTEKYSGVVVDPVSWLENHGVNP